MKRRLILRSIPFAISSWASAVYSQTLQSDDIAQRFNKAAAKHKRELRDLWKYRSAPIISLRDVSSESIAKVLAIRTQDSNQITYLEYTSVIFYSHDENYLQIWLINEFGIQAYQRQNISKQKISQAIVNLRKSLNVDSLQHSRIPRQINNHQDVSVDSDPKLSRDQAITEVTQILFPHLIASKLGAVKHLIVVPFLEIGTVPYALLKPFKSNLFLIDRMSISIASSLFDLGLPLFEFSLEKSYQSALIVGNPYFPKSDNWLIPPLPSAEEEVLAVSKILNVTPLIGNKATKLEVLAKVERSRLLYFATHGVASSQNPLSESFLMFSADSLEKGLWTAQEIQITKLRAEMAVLSACQTGLGKSHDAGMIGLARAFQIAGVPRVVMSLWSVDDQATSELMLIFMNQLKTKIPSEALRQAMLEMKQKQSEPALWASFVVFGTPR